MHRRAFIAAAFLALAACATRPSAVLPEEKLYLALELRHDGALVGQPKLLGETGKTLRAERRQPGAQTPDWRLTLLPRRAGESFELALQVEADGAQGQGQLAILHGQQRRVRMGELEVSLTLMKVDSPEFRALMDLTEEDARLQQTSAI